MGHRTRKYQPGPAAITLGRYTQTLPAELARVAICSTRSSPSAFPRTPLGADAEFSFPPAFPRLRRPACQAGLHRTSAGLQNRQGVVAPRLEGSIPSPLRSIEGEENPRARGREPIAVATCARPVRMIVPTTHSIGPENNSPLLERIPSVGLTASLRALSQPARASEPRAVLRRRPTCSAAALPGAPCQRESCRYGARKQATRCRVVGPARG
jgi:hypothetical protein